eukprot:GHVS01069407.1.p2 GENE.GHVS01069407.1~~GHVS01069407.1.p2  ORF type:complete len:213 (+),score=24.36 GHVS01069407.1:90-641(+)
MVAMPEFSSRSEAEEEWALVADGQSSMTGKPPSPCGCCGGSHWMRECPHKSARCEKCHRLGHIEPACKATVLKTPDGRIDVYILPRPGSLEFRQYRDRTQQDRIRSAKNVLAEILGRAETNSAKDKAKREDKKGKRPDKRRRDSTETATPAHTHVQTYNNRNIEETVVWAEEAMALAADTPSH